jgi:acyl-coenzyme A thioesterase 13
VSASENFSPLFRTSPVLDLIGPLYYRGKGSDLVLGLRIDSKHCNARGTVHGGVLATLADVAMGYAAAFDSDPPRALSTAHLSLGTFGLGRVGQSWRLVGSRRRHSKARLTARLRELLHL